MFDRKKLDSTFNTPWGLLFQLIMQCFYNKIKENLTTLMSPLYSLFECLKRYVQ